MAKKDFVISSLRGGLNDTDPPIMLDPDQLTVADNVEFDAITLGARRLGCTAVTLSGGLGANPIAFLYRNIPSNDETGAELFAMSTTGAAVTMEYKDTSWHAVTFTDTPTATSPYAYEWCAASIHGKLFLAYKSGTDRLHVRDAGATNFRRSGLATPAAPSAANTGGGTYSGTRYFRVRYTVQSGGSTIRRSEPSSSTTFAPSGAGLSARITKPASISESETHWEVEASLDNANFYRITTVVVGTTTYDDSTAFGTGYAVSGVLSEDSGDYTVLHSAKFLAVDGDRLLLAGAWEQSALSSRFTWTPVYNDPGVGNDERSPLDTDNFIDLDTYEGGEITDLSNTVNGYTYVFKRSHTYQMTRTGLRTRAYDAHALSKTIGAIPHSVVEGIDEQGRPCLYFVDQNLGPCRVGAGGVQTCSRDVLTTWRTLNRDTVVVVRGLFYPASRQVIWHLSTGSATTPDVRMVLQTDLTRQTNYDGIRKGWAKHTGTIAGATSCCLFASNIDAGTARAYSLVPFIGTTTGTILRCDTGTTDNGASFIARMVTAPVSLAGILNKFGVMAGALMAKAASGVTLTVNILRDFGLETAKSVTAISLTPFGSETTVIAPIDNLSDASNKVVQIEFTDDIPSTGTWELYQFAFKPRPEDTA